VIIRSREQQQPAAADKALLQLIVEHFKDRPHDFEHFAAELWRISEPRVDRIDVTRPWRDGGRDAVGEYLLGPRADPVAVEFAMEAKCFILLIAWGFERQVGLFLDCATGNLVFSLQHPISTSKPIEKYGRMGTL